MRLTISFALLLAGSAIPADAQQRDTLPDRDPSAMLGIRVHGHIGIVFGHDVAREAIIAPEEATRVTETNIGALVRGGVEYRFRRGIGTFATLGASLAPASETTSNLTVTSKETGLASQFDLMAGVSWQPPIRQREPEPVSLHVAGGAAWIAGPEDMAAFGAYEDHTPFNMWEAGISFHPGGVLGGTAAFQSIDVIPRVNEDGGRMQRIVLLLRVGR